jgi:hypothetical protein
MSVLSARLLAVGLLAWSGCGSGTASNGNRAARDGGALGGDGPAGAAGPVAVVSFVKVVSDKVEDVSSMEAWQQAFLSPDMTDEQKALAIWRSVVKFRNQDEPPREYLDFTTHVHDPIRDFNVYGYAQCCCASAFIEALGRAAGLPVRGRALTAHSVPEVFFAGAWHLFDGAYINYFRKPDGAIAAVDELIAAVAPFYVANPSLLGDTAGLTAVRTSGAWRSGPSLLASCPFYDADGLWPAGIQGWDTTMHDYDGTHGDLIEFGYTLGYRVNVQLHKGERLIRNWSNEGRHINQPDAIYCTSVTDVVGQGELRWAPAYGDLAPGRVGNGTVEWDVPLADEEILRAALASENFAPGAPAHAADGARPATLTLRRVTSYVYLGGALTFQATIGDGGGAIDVEVSTNHGLDWTALAHLTADGAQRLDLSPSIYRRYDYRLRFTLRGAAGLDGLRVVEQIQHSQAVLPALGAGDNQIAVSAGAAEGTITVQSALDPSLGAKALSLADVHAAVDGLSGAPLQAPSGSGTLTLPVATPGDLLRLRFGAMYRAEQPNDRWDYRVSFDGGATFTTVASVAGPAGPGNVRYVTFSDVPPGTRSALVQFSGTGAVTLFDYRIDADYAEPAGGFRPIRVTYAWQENGVDRSHVHVAAQPDDHYAIHCDATPLMKSVTVEPAD